MKDLAPHLAHWLHTISASFLQPRPGVVDIDFAKLYFNLGFHNFS